MLSKDVFINKVYIKVCAPQDTFYTAQKQIHFYLIEYFWEN